MSRPRCCAAALGLLLLAALGFAIVAGKDGSPTRLAGRERPRTILQRARASGGFDGAALPARQAAPAFALTDQYGRRSRSPPCAGSLVVLAFLYSRCGAPCVLIAQQIRGALDELGASRCRC